jgi:hypothetical protein
METTIKILRLLSGEDIISYTEAFNDGYIVHEPMAFMLKVEHRTGKETVSMENWLPQSLLKNNVTTVYNKDILAVMTPSSVFNEFYTNLIDTVLKKRGEEAMDDEEDDLSEDEIGYLMDSIDTSTTYIN